MNNPGIAFDESMLLSHSFDNESISQRLASLKSAAISRELLLSIISYLDLTSLNATDTSATIDVLLEKAKQPIKGHPIKVAAVCVYQPYIQQAVKNLIGTDIGIATVAGGFPSGQMDLNVKCADIQQSVLMGATEIDVVIRRSLALTQDWKGLYEEVSTFKQHSLNAKLKVILATGELSNPDIIFKTSLVCMMAGADTIKTSTGLEKINATLEAGFIMMKAIHQFYTLTGIKVGLKPAGGIRTVEQALLWLQLLKEELGGDWENKHYFRIGASALLDDVIQHL